MRARDRRRNNSLTEDYPELKYSPNGVIPRSWFAPDNDNHQLHQSQLQQSEPLDLSTGCPTAGAVVAAGELRSADAGCDDRVLDLSMTSELRHNDDDDDAAEDEENAVSEAGNSDNDDEDDGEPLDCSCSSNSSTGQIQQQINGGLNNSITTTDDDDEEQEERRSHPVNESSSSQVSV